MSCGLSLTVRNISTTQGIYKTVHLSPRAHPHMTTPCSRVPPVLRRTRSTNHSCSHTPHAPSPHCHPSARPAASSSTWLQLSTVWKQYDIINSDTVMTTATVLNDDEVVAWRRKQQSFRRLYNVQCQLKATAPSRYNDIQVLISSIHGWWCSRASYLLTYLHTYVVYGVKSELRYTHGLLACGRV